MWNGAFKLTRRDAQIQVFFTAGIDIKELAINAEDSTFQYVNGHPVTVVHIDALKCFATFYSGTQAQVVFQGLEENEAFDARAHLFAHYVITRVSSPTSFLEARLVIESMFCKWENTIDIFGLSKFLDSQRVPNFQAENYTNLTIYVGEQVGNPGEKISSITVYSTGSMRVFVKSEDNEKVAAILTHISQFKTQVVHESKPQVTDTKLKVGKWKVVTGLESTTTALVASSGPPVPPTVKKKWGVRK